MEKKNEEKGKKNNWMNNQKEHKQNIDDITGCSRQIFIKENNKQKFLVVVFFL